VAFLLTHFWPHATMEQYNTTIAALWPAHGLPEGEVFHAAGPTDGGILIAAIWASKEDFERFLKEQFMPSMPIEGGLTGMPEQRAAEIENHLVAISDASGR
jgi:hypothetical protein